MAISLRTAGSWAFAASGSVTPTLPTHQSGDMLIVRVAAKSSNIASLDITTATSGWARVGQFRNGTNNSGNGTGSVQVAAFWKIATSSSETAPQIDFSQTVTQVGHVAMAYQKGAAPETWSTPVGDGGGDTTSGTTHSATIQSHVSATVGDLIDFFSAQCDDTVCTVPTFTQASATLDAVTESPATAGTDTSGADGAYDGGFRKVTSGTSSAAAVVTNTLSTSETGSSFTTRLRVFSPEEHFGSTTLTGGGVATPAGVKQGLTSQTITGAGIEFHTAVKQALAAQSATGGGVATSTSTSAHTGSDTVTGGGVATPVWAGAHVAAESATGGGSATPSAVKQGLSAQTLTASGTVAETQTTARVGSQTGTGGGSVVPGPGGAHFGTASATGGGVATQSGLKSGQSAQQVTASGAATPAQTTARAASQTLTGGGVVSYSYSVGGGGGEQHFGSATLTGGGVVVPFPVKQGLAAQSGTGSGVASAAQTTSRVGLAVLTGGGVVTYEAEASGSVVQSGPVVLTGGGVVVVVGRIDAVTALVNLALEVNNDDPVAAGNWLLVWGAMRANRGRMPIRDPLIGSIHRKANAATYARACIALGVVGPVLEDLKALGGVA